MTPRGAASPHFRNGLHSRYALPASLAAALDGTRLGVNQLALDGELVVLRARAQQILDHLDRDGEGAWPSLLAVLGLTRKTVETEARRMLLCGGLLPAASLLSLTAMIVDEARALLSPAQLDLLANRLSARLGGAPVAGIVDVTPGEPAK